MAKVLVDLNFGFGKNMDKKSDKNNIGLDSSH